MISVCKPNQVLIASVPYIEVFLNSEFTQK